MIFNGRVAHTETHQQSLRIRKHHDDFRNPDFVLVGHGCITDDPGRSLSLASAIRCEAHGIGNRYIGLTPLRGKHRFKVHDEGEYGCDGEIQ